MEGSKQLAALVMLGVLAAAAGGCAAPTASAQRTVAPISYKSEDRPVAPAPVVAHRSDDAALRRTVEEELGPEVAEELPPIEREPPKPRDAGADALVNQMLVGMRDLVRDEDGVMRVCVGKLRNLSRASAAEFDEFIERFADVLSRSGSDSDVVFLAKRIGEDVHYDMLGTAYLITAEGFDLWELFITITPADAGWTVWQPAGPVRVLRHARPGHQQIFPSR